MYRQKIIRSCSKPARLMNWEWQEKDQSQLHWLCLRALPRHQGSLKRSNCWKLTWQALGNACSICLVPWVPGQAWSKGKSLFCWLALIKRDQKWGDLNWFLNVAFLASTAQCPFQPCQDLRMWGHKADFKPEEQNQLLALGRWKRTHFFSQLSSKPGAEFSPVRTKIAQ